MRAITDNRPRRRAWHRKAPTLEITLHIGAHRTATTRFQHYMRRHARPLTRRGIGFWGPLRTRAGLLTDILANPGQDHDQAQAARRRLLSALERAEKAGTKHLVLSDENIPGLPVDNIRNASLYPQVGPRVARLSEATEHRIDRVVLTVRPHHDYWASLLAYTVQRGHPVPDAAQIDRIARGPRLWQDMLRELASVQGGQLCVLRHHTPPGAALAAMTGGAVEMPEEGEAPVLNAAPDRAELRASLRTRGEDPGVIPAGEGRWQPFDADQRTIMAESWLDDEFWLAAGAGGIATYLPEGHNHGTKTSPARAGHHLPPGLLGRGHRNGIEERRLVGSG